MQSLRRVARTSFAATSPRALGRLLVLLNLVGLLATSATPSQARQQSTDPPPLPEARKAGATAPQAKAGDVELDLAELNVAEFLRDCDHQGAEIHKQLLSYTYRLKKVRREYKAEKAVEKQSQEFEAYPVRGQHVLIQLIENGVPLPSSEIEWQRRRAGENLERAEREAEQQQPSGPVAASELDGYPAAGVYGRVRRRPVGVSIDPSTILRAGELTAPRRERLNEREAIVFNFRLRPGAELPWRKTYLARLSGQVWIDALDKVLVRVEAWPTDEYRKTDPASMTGDEPRLVYQQTKLATGAWVPSLMRMNSGGNPELFGGLNWDVVFEFTDYKQFTTSSDDLKLDQKKSSSN